jgi:hypothetical protein
LILSFNPVDGNLLQRDSSNGTVANYATPYGGTGYVSVQL